MNLNTNTYTIKIKLFVDINYKLFTTETQKYQDFSEMSSKKPFITPEALKYQDVCEIRQ